MKNEIKLFENKQLGFQARTMLNEDGSISVNAEDTAIGYGWTQGLMKCQKRGSTTISDRRMPDET